MAQGALPGGERRGRPRTGGVCATHAVTRHGAHRLPACGLQLAAAIPNFLCQEQVNLGDGYIKEPFKVENGYVRIPTKPGLGIELDDHAMADKIGHDWMNAETYFDKDGSVVDW